jgi:arylsulfatase A-like enzyme
MKYALGCMDNSEVDTPNIDRLAQRGTLFKSAYSTTPVCSPFRVNLVTGLYNLESGADANCCKLPEGCHSLVSDFNMAGYQTSFIGKWHVGIGGNRPIEKAFRAEFQEVMGYQCYNSFLKDVCFFDNDNQKHQFDEHRTDVTGELAVEKIKGMGEDPFLLVVGFQAPHYPEEPGPKYNEMYRERKVTPRPNYSGLDPFIPTVHPKNRQPLDQCPNFRRYGNNIHEYLRCYYALCTQIDHNVGRILDQLEDSGKAEETVVLFTSDHGDMAGSHGFNGKARSYEEAAGIPLIMAGPGVPKGIEVQAPIDSASFLPTCMDMVGVEMPEHIQSRVRTGLLEYDDAKAMAFSSFVTKNWCMVRKGSKKLTLNYSTNEPTMFFDVTSDPYEQKNLVTKVMEEAESKEMLVALLKWKEDCRTYREKNFKVPITTE